MSAPLNNKKQQAIEEEFGQSAADVIRGFTDDGYGSELIASFIGVSRKTVKRWAAEYGIVLNKRTRADLQDQRPPTQQCLKAAAEANSMYVEFRGERVRVADFDKPLGLKPGAVLVRITKKGWPVEKALTTPKRQPFYSKTKLTKPSADHWWRKGKNHEQSSAA